MQRHRLAGSPHCAAQTSITPQFALEGSVFIGGAAYLAVLSCGVFAGLEELAAHWKVDRTFHPTLSRDRADELMQRWEHAVAQATLKSP